MDYRQKQYFNNKEALFLEKKQIFIEISAGTNTIKSLHAKLKLLKEGDEMQETAEKLIDLDTTRTNNWKKLDSWQLIS